MIDLEKRKRMRGNLERGSRENKESVLLLLDPAEQLVHRRDNGQLGHMGRQDGVQLKGLGEPAQDGLLAGC